MQTTGGNFAKNELPVIAGSVATAVAVTGAVVMTGGAAGVVIPLWGVALAGAVGGVVGSELTQEGMYALRQGWGSDTSKGDSYYGSRSLLGKKVGDDKVYNYDTGRFEKVTWGQVTTSYGQQLAVSFATSFATMGVSNAIGGRMSSFLQQSKMMDRLAATESGKKLVVVLSKINSGSKTAYEKGKWNDAYKRMVSELPAEFADEMSDEAFEDLGERMLKQLNSAELGQGNIAAVILGSIKGTRLNSNTITYKT